MKITEVRVYPVNKDTLIAMANVTFDGCFVVTGIKIVKGEKGNFIAMPSKKVGEEYKDICFPVTKEFRQELIKTILDKYENTNDEGLPFK